MGSRQCGAQDAKVLKIKSEGTQCYVLLSFATTKAKEHIVVYCPGILSNENSSDANPRHTLVINLPRGVLSTISKVGLALRKLYLL
jgi:hypothetical protein